MELVNGRTAQDRSTAVPHSLVSLSFRMYRSSTQVPEAKFFAAESDFPYEGNNQSQAYVPQSNKFKHPYYSGALAVAP